MSQVPPAPDSSDLLSEADVDLLLQGLGAAGAGAGGVASLFDHVIATGEPPPAVLQHFAEHGGLPSFVPAAIRNQVNEVAAAGERMGGGCAAPASERPSSLPHLQAGVAPAAATAAVAVNPPRRVSRRVRTAARARSAGPAASAEESGSGAGSGAGSGGGSSSPSASVNAARKRKPRTRPRRPATTTNQASRAHKKARTKSRATGSSTTYERRRRARVGELMQTLTKLLFPAGVVDTTSDECHSVDQADADASRRKVKKPTKTDVLAAAVHTIRHASSSPQALVDPDPGATVVSAPRSGTFPEDPMQQVAIGARVFQSMVAEFQLPHSREIVAMVFRLAEEQYDDDLKHEADLQQPTATGAPRSSSPTSKSPHNAAAAAVTATGRTTSGDSGAQRRIAVVSRIFRLCLPIIFRVCASHGLYNLLSLSELLTYFRQLFNLPQCREALGQIRCLWIAPQLLSSSPDQVPKDRMLAALRRIWREMSSEEFRARVPGLLSDVTGIAMAMDRMLPYIYPMWEDGAESLGFSRSLEGVARFHRSATTFDDPEIIELSWRCIGSVPEVLRDWLRHRVSEVDAEAGSFLEMPEVATPVVAGPTVRESEPPLHDD